MIRLYHQNFKELLNYCHEHAKDIFLIRGDYSIPSVYCEFAILINADEDKSMVWLTSMGQLPFLGQHLSNSDVTYFIRGNTVELYFPKISHGSKWHLLSRLTVQELSKFLEFLDLFIK